MKEAREEEAWFTGLADELSQALVDARECAAACEELLEASRGSLEPSDRQRLLAALVAPAAISRILIDLIDRPPAFVLAAAQVCRETTRVALEQLDALPPPLDVAAAAAALERVCDSCERLLEAADAA